MNEIIEVKVTTIVKEITTPLINQHDAKATSLEIYGINDEDGVVTCRLYEGDKLIEGKRVIELADLPCAAITEAEREILFPPVVEIEAENVAEKK